MLLKQLPVNAGRGISGKAQRLLAAGAEITHWGKSQLVVDACELKYGGLFGVSQVGTD